MTWDAYNHRRAYAKHPEPPVDSMITALDVHAASTHSDELKAEDPRTWREVYDANLVTSDDVACAYRHLADQ